MWAQKVSSLRQLIVSSSLIADKLLKDSFTVIYLKRYYGNNARVIDSVMFGANEEKYVAQASTKKKFCGLHVCFHLS